MDRSPLAAGLAVAGLLGWGLVELAFRARTPAARSLRGDADDRGTTRLTAVAVAVALAAPWTVRLLAGPPPPPSPARLAGASAVLAAGLALRGWAMASLGAAFTRALRVAPDAALVERGPYRRVRHPGYAAALLVLPAHALLAAGVGVAAATFVGLGIVYALRIRAEEAMLARRLGPAWEAYRRRTARLLPGLL